jgi:preprotein translocase subunit SecF
MDTSTVTNTVSSLPTFLLKALGPVVLFGGLAWFFRDKVLGANKTGLFSNIFDFMKRKEERKQDEKVIKSLEQQQTVVVANIQNQENLSVEQQKKIRDAVDKASTIIQQTLNETDKTKIAENVDKDWDKL